MRTELFVVVVAVAVLAAIVALAARARIERWSRRRRLRAQSAHALAGERLAEQLLHDAGFTVVARQARLPWAIVVDGVEVPVDLRADLLVEREGRSFVAEVKTGQRAPRVDTATTRRQLLEYRVAFDVDGALLVDAEERRVHEVVFPLDVGRWGFGVGVLCFVALAGAALGAVVVIVAR